MTETSTGNEHAGGSGPVLAPRDNWIFDMDGTLTIAVHDFEAIRRALAIPPGEPILEYLAHMPAERSEPLYRRLDELELEYARKARPQPGAPQLLEALLAAGKRVSILTRNGEQLAEVTLAACGLADFFEPADVLGRESATPKPSPAGIQRQLARWQADADSAVMVGDYVFDLQAGAAAGCATIYFDPVRALTWRNDADFTVHSHLELQGLAFAGPMLAG